MSGSTLRDFPEEVTHGPWPSLKPTAEDYRYVPQPKPVNSKEPFQLQPDESESLQQLLLSLVLAMLEGAILGALLYVFVVACLPLYEFWFLNWRWLYLCGIVVIARLFFSTKHTLIISSAVTIILGGVIIFLQSFTITLWPEGWHYFYPTIILVSMGLLFVFFRILWATGISLAIAIPAACWFSRSFLLTHLFFLFVLSLGGALTRLLLKAPILNLRSREDTMA